MLQPLSQLEPPITLEECKSYLRIFDDSHNVAITLMRDAAISAVESYTRQRFRVSTFMEAFEDAEAPVLRAFPIISLDEVLVDGVAVDSEDLAAIEFSRQCRPSTVSFEPGSGLTLLPHCEITYKAGWEVWPADLKLLILERMAESFENRTTQAANKNEFKFSHLTVLNSYSSDYDALGVVNE